MSRLVFDVGLFFLVSTKISGNISGIWNRLIFEEIRTIVFLKGKKKLGQILSTLRGSITILTFTTIALVLFKNISIQFFKPLRCLDITQVPSLQYMQQMKVKIVLRNFIVHNRMSLDVCNTCAFSRIETLPFL